MSALKVDECGTYSRYSAGRCRCEACRAAARAYMQEYRKRNARVRQEAKQRARDYRRADAVLRERHRAEFDAIYAEIRGTA